MSRADGGGGGGEVQLEESLWGVSDPLREAEEDVEQLGCTKVTGGEHRLKSAAHSSVCSSTESRSKLVDTCRLFSGPDRLEWWRSHAKAEIWLFHLSSTRTTPHLTRKQRTYGGFVCSPSTRAAEMWSCITDFFTYETTKSVVVKSWTIGIINRIVQLIIITYFIGWVFQALPVILHYRPKPASRLNYSGRARNVYVIEVDLLYYVV